MIENIKTKLLSLDIVVDNKYLDMYCKLIASNISTARQVYKTQKHHIVPRCYFNYNHLQIDNSSSNIVNLYYSDHILAHYYLTLCAKSDQFKYANEAALLFVLGRSSIYLNKSIDEITLQLEKYQQIYEDFKLRQSAKYKNRPRTGYIVSDKTKQKMHEAISGRIYVHNNVGYAVQIRPELLEQYLADG